METGTQDRTDSKKEIQLIDPEFSLVPKSLEEAMKYADMIAKSSLVPDCFKGKPSDVLIAVQIGLELNLKPLQALQNIAIINGRAALWGDLLPALAKGSGLCEYILETFDEKTKTAICRAKRRGDPNEHVRTFSFEDATQAGLLKKAGPWTNYPKRMAQMRARAFLIRDVWPDVLKGMPVAEEVEDYETTKKTPAMPERTMPEAEVVHTQAPIAPEAPAPTPQPAPDADQKMATKEQVKELVALCKEHKVDLAAFGIYLKTELAIPSQDHIPESKLPEIKGWITREF